MLVSPFANDLIVFLSAAVFFGEREGLTGEIGSGIDLENGMAVIAT